MCIATFALGSSADLPLVFAANRDEVHTRPTAEADWWADDTAVLGGRDLVAGGSWLAIDRRGRLAAVTNIPSNESHERPRSRGTLVRDFLTADASAADFVADVAAQAAEYSPFNFLAYDGHELHYVGTDSVPRQIEPGVHALSNASFGEDWPKIRSARAGLSESLEGDSLEVALFELLMQGADGTAKEVSRDQRRNKLFIKDPRHGTRSSTVVLLGADGTVRFAERSFTATGEPDGERVHEFAIGR